MYSRSSRAVEEAATEAEQTNGTEAEEQTDGTEAEEQTDGTEAEGGEEEDEEEEIARYLPMLSVTTSFWILKRIHIFFICYWSGSVYFSYADLGSCLLDLLLSLFLKFIYFSSFVFEFKMTIL